MQKYIRHHVLIAAMTLAVSAVSQLRAESGIAVSAQAYRLGGPGSADEAYNINLETGSASSYTYQNANVLTFAAGSVSASFGELHLSNHVDVDPNNYQTASSVLAAGWVDTFTIQSPGREGQQGFYQGIVFVHMDYSGAGSSGGYIGDNVFNVWVGSVFQSNFPNANLGFNTGTIAGGHGYDDMPLSFTVPFTFGTPFDIAVSMASNITFRAQGSDISGGSITHNAGNTLNWGGTVSVQDQNNTPLASSDFNLSSQSGTDYLAPIPEPSTSVLLIGGVAAVLFCRYKRKRR